jgi:hypothetical protein
MLRKIHGTKFFHIKFLGRTNNKCQNGLVLPPAQVFYFSGQALHHMTEINSLIPNVYITQYGLRCRLNQIAVHPSIYTYIHTYPRFIPEGAPEAPQILLRDTHASPKLVSHEEMEEHRRRNRW